MKKSKLLIKSFLLFAFTYSLSTQFSVAQLPYDFCQKMQKIIAEAENGTFNNFRGAQQTNTSYEMSYASTIKIVNSASIHLNKEKGWTYQEFLSFSDTNLQVYYNALVSCLPSPTWTLVDATKNNQKTWIFKNLTSRVFVSIGYPGVMLQVYLQKTSTAKCLWGDCQNGYGSYIFENNDVYTGDFIGGRLNGYGKYTWAASGESYDGSWLNGKMNGYGTMYDKNEKVKKEGLIYENNWINVDTKTMTNFTMGITDNGFGMVFDNGKYQICNHKDRKPWGMALVNNVNTVFGNYENGFNGFCIFYYPDGSSYYGNFVSGVMKGKGKKYLTDETSFEGEFDGSNAKGAKYDKNNILIQKETWTNNVLSLDNSSASQALSAFAKSLSYLCSTLPTDLKGALITDDIITVYASKYKLYGAAKTEIHVEPKTFMYFISSKMNSGKLTKSSALIEYNSLVEKLRTCLSSVWKGTETTNKDDINNLFRNYTYSSNLYDYNINVNCWFNDLYIEIKYTE